MNLNKFAVTGRARLWVMDAVVGALVALVAITAAQAALPDRAAPLAAVAKVRAPAPVAPTDLIAFVQPAPGQAVVSPFGLRKLPWEAAARLHAGVDIAAPRGVAVLAVADGVVVEAGADASSGRYIRLRHVEGLTSVYAHLDAITPGLVAGASVRTGAPVGAVGDSGSSSGPHLHFEIRDAANRPMDPAAFLGRRFAAATDLPLAEAAQIPRRVRMAYVSQIPPIQRARMAALAAVEVATVQVKPLGDGVARKALIAQIAAAQKVEMVREAAARPRMSIAGAGASTTAAIDEAAPAS